MVRKCTQCGTVDREQSWASMEEASADGVFERAWACSSCAWTEFDIVSDETAEGESA
jgi:hypothetical protein